MEVFNTLSIDTDTKTCYIDNEKVSLSYNEYTMLLFLMTNRNIVHSRLTLLRIINSEHSKIRAVDTCITRLRKRIGRYADNIITKRGFGYGFIEGAISSKPKNRKTIRSNSF